MKSITPLRYIPLGLLIFISINSFGTYQWTLKSSFPSTGRNLPSGISIGSHVFIGLGYYAGTLNNDFWDWNQNTDTWTQIASFPGSTQFGCVSFAVGPRGYMCTGGNLPLLYTENWEYDPANNQWTQKASFPGAGRYLAIGFAIGSFGYVSTGYTPAQVRDNYQYNSQNDIWVQKNNFGGVARQSAVGFSLDGKGYIGTGYSISGTNLNDFWEYDQISDAWTQKANFPGVPRYGASGFAIDSLHQCFVGSGGDGTSFFRDFYSFDPTQNSWVQIDSLPGVGRRHTSSFTIGTKGYLACGVTTGPNFLNDLWEYGPVLPDEIAENKPESKYISVYPNPAVSNIFLKSNDPNYIFNTIRIFDSSGKLVQSLKLESNGSTMDVSELKSGLYFAEIITKEKVILGTRFVKE